MAQIIFRDASAYSNTYYALPDTTLSLEEMARRMEAYPLEDCSFVGDIMSILYGQPTDPEVWDSDLVSFKHGVLVFQCSWTYFHSREHTKITEIRLQEGEL